MDVMDKEKQFVEHVFGVALELNPEGRKAFLDEACVRHPQARGQVEALLQADEQAGSFLGHPLVRLGGEASITQEQAHLQHADVPSRFKPGQVIASRFTVVRFIDQGGMGEVYEVTDGFLQHVHIALKVILPEIAAGAWATERFEQEVLLAHKVSHPNLCPIYDISLCAEPAPAFLFLTMKLLHGETLASRLKKMTPLSREEAMAIFQQMVAGVAAIHAAGVVHRDIKPKNVMLDHSSGALCLSIMDFGLARLHESESTMATRGLVAGTPGYIAPELYLGQRPSQASDIYALGVLLHQVLTGALPVSRADSLAAEPSSALAIANAPAALVRAVEEFLSEDAKRRCDAFAQAQGGFSGRLSMEQAATQRGPLVTRRRFVVGSTVAVCGAVGASAAGPDWLDRWLHPLPKKRFVALLNWPSPDARLKPLLLGIIDAIAGELSRAEAFDRDLFVIAQDEASDLTTPAQLREARESLGANLVLAAHAVPRGRDIHLSLRVLDPSLSAPLREKEIRVSMNEQASLPERAVRAAAKLLDVTSYSPDDQRTRPGTQSAPAFAAFQAAEALLRQSNETGLDAAIEKYKQALNLDPHFARAYAKLGLAYLRFYRLRGDTGAVSLARANCDSALRMDSNLVEGHIVMAHFYRQTGDRDAAIREISKALFIDPSDPYTLVSQAQIYGAMEEWSKAESTLARVLIMRPNYWQAHNELGFVFNSQGKYKEALLEFRSASLAAPQDALAFSNLGSIYLQQGKLREALESTKKSFAIHPNDAAAETLASVYRALRDHGNAIAFAQRAVQLAPAETVDWLELGDCYAAAGTRRVDAEAAYSRAMQTQKEKMLIEASNGPGWMLLGLCCAKAQHRDLATKFLLEADRLQAGDVDSQLYKARLLELLGRRGEALTVLARCLQRGATAPQINFIPDLEELRVDPHYRSLLNSTLSANETS